jgi:hypothetical protein
MELVPISEHLHQHKIGYTKEARHRPYARVKTNIKNIKELHTHDDDYHSTIRIDVSTREISSLYGTNIKTQFSQLIYTGQSCSFFTSAAIMGVQTGEMSNLGWLIGWSIGVMWVVSLYFSYVVDGSVYFFFQGNRFPFFLTSGSTFISASTFAYVGHFQLRVHGWFTKIRRQNVIWCATWPVCDYACTYHSMSGDGVCM